MQIYLAQGFRRFVLLTGYRAELIEAFAEGEIVAGGDRRAMRRHGTADADRWTPRARRAV